MGRKGQWTRLSHEEDGTRKGLEKCPPGPAVADLWAALTWCLQERVLALCPVKGVSSVCTLQMDVSPGESSGFSQTPYGPCFCIPAKHVTQVPSLPSLVSAVTRGPAGFYLHFSVWARVTSGVRGPTQTPTGGAVLSCWPHVRRGRDPRRQWMISL